MTAKQLRELCLFYEIEPFGEYRSELRHGQSQALHLNLNRDPKREPFKASDCMNYVDPEPEKIYSEEELEAYAKSIFGV